MTYQEFLASKAIVAQERGFDGPVSFRADLKPHARDIAAWMIRGGNRACFASFGLHKTSIQLQVCESLLDAGAYYADGVRYCRAAEQKISMPTLFDLEAAPEDFAVAPETITTAQAGDFGARLGIQDSLKEEALRRAPRKKAEL
jgi:hypothetical protein